MTLVTNSFLALSKKKKIKYIFRQFCRQSQDRKTSHRQKQNHSLYEYVAYRLTDRHGDRQKTSIWPFCYWSSIVYSADVIDSHRAPTAGQASPESSDPPPSPQNDQPASSRAVIILIPVRLGGEKTNPDYFNFAKVRDAWRSELSSSQ